MRHWLTGLLISSALLVSITAAAEDFPWPRSMQNRAGLEIDIFPLDQAFVGSNIDVVSMGFVPFAQIGVHDNVFIDVELPIAAYAATSDVPGFNPNDGAALGSITVGAHYADVVLEKDDLDLSFWAGGVIGIPTMLADDPDGEPALAGALALVHHGLADTHRYTIEAVPLRVGAGIELQALDKLLFFRSSIAPVFWIPINGDTEVLMEQINELEFRAKFGLGGGMRVQEVFLFTADDVIQLAVEPFIGYEPEKAGVMARFGLMLPLDEGLGPAFNNGRVRTVRMMVGGKW